MINLSYVIPSVIKRIILAFCSMIVLLITPAYGYEYTIVSDGGEPEWIEVCQSLRDYIERHDSAETYLQTGSLIDPDNPDKTFSLPEYTEITVSPLELLLSLEIQYKTIRHNKENVVDAERYNYPYSIYGSIYLDKDDWVGILPGNPHDFTQAEQLASAVDHWKDWLSRHYEEYVDYDFRLYRTTFDINNDGEEEKIIVTRLKYPDLKCDDCHVQGIANGYIVDDYNNLDPKFYQQNRSNWFRIATPILYRNHTWMLSVYIFEEDRMEVSLIDLITPYSSEVPWASTTVICKINID